MAEKIQKQRIVVVGGGFGGVKTVLELAKHADLFDITLVSERADFWYFPTLYHTATGGTRAQSSIAITHLLKNKQVTFVLGKLEGFDKTAKTVSLSGTEKGKPATVPYDKLVLALGSVTNYFNIPGLQEFSFGIKSIEQAEDLKRHLHKQIIDKGEPDMSYVIVGGGPTGIELAGALGQYIKETLERHKVSDHRVHVDLVEHGKHLMPRMPASVGRAIEHQLRRLGVRLYLGEAVQGQTADELTLGSKVIRSHTVIWTAGQSNNPFFTAERFTLSPRKKALVDEFLRSYEDHNVFVIGDNAETMYSGMAQTAIYDADFVADNFIREAKGKTKLAYTPKKPIYVLPAGKRWAAVEWGNFHVYGFMGWLLREAGDFVAFNDIEPPLEAAAQMSQSLAKQHLCDTCGSVS